eukprot:361405-Rhodomonas_salina.1
MAWGHRCRWSLRTTQERVSAINKQLTINSVGAQDPAMGYETLIFVLRRHLQYWGAQNSTSRDWTTLRQSSDH